MRQLVRLRTRPSRDGKSFTYLLDYVNEDGQRKRISLGHSDRRKADRQYVQKERELRMGVVAPESMRLSEFLEDSLMRTRGQVRESTLLEQNTAMKNFIEAIGDIDFQKVHHRHSERFIQACLDKGNSPATVNKKISGLKRMFQLAVNRGQLEENPFKHMRRLKTPKRRIHVYTDEQCRSLIRAARELYRDGCFDWELLVVLALCTAMRRGELLNTTWRDIDFEKQTIEVSPKKSTDYTWEWHIKDTERRILPLTEEVIRLLAQRQAVHLEGCPYVFVPKLRYDYIQKLRQQGNWTLQHGARPINNFNRKFRMILDRAGIGEGEFHDPRRTCLTRWFSNGLAEYDVMNLAGHTDFETTHNFYLGVREDLLDRARVATAAAMSTDFGAHLARAPSEDLR
jgi:integrase